MCEQRQVIGPCEAAIQKYWYNITTDDCERFYYGGCYGNDNMFDEYDDCRDACGGQGQHILYSTNFQQFFVLIKVLESTECLASACINCLLFFFFFFYLFI